MEEKDKIEYNWYEILGLEFYPVAEENEEIIKKRIEKKETSGEEIKIMALAKQWKHKYILIYITLYKNK